MKRFTSYLATTAVLFPSLCFANTVNVSNDDRKKICAVDSKETDIRKAYTAALEKSANIPLRFALTAGTMQNLITYCRYKPGEKISKRESITLPVKGTSEYALHEKINSDSENCKKVNNLFVEVSDHIEQGVMGSPNGIKTTPQLTDARILDVLAFLDDTNPKFKVTCETPLGKPKKKEDPTPGLNFNLSKFSVTKDYSTITEKLDKKESAEFSVKLDRGEKEKIEDGDETRFENKDVISANFTLAFVDLLQFTPTKKADEPKDITPPGPSISPFITLAYESAFDPLEEKDDLTFGVVWKQYFSDRHFSQRPKHKKIYKDDYVTLNGFDNGPASNFQFELDRFLLEGSYITDISEFQSQQWTAQLAVPFMSYDYNEFEVGGLNLSGYLAFDLLADYLDIARAGDKKALIKFTEEQDVKTLKRLGYDIRGNVRIELDTEWALKLSSKYQFRDATRTGGLGDANRLEVGFDYLPNLDSNLSLGLTYERGEAIKTLKDEEFWKFGVKYKQ